MNEEYGQIMKTRWSLPVVLLHLQESGTIE